MVCRIKECGGDLPSLDQAELCRGVSKLQMGLVDSFLRHHIS